MAWAGIILGMIAGLAAAILGYAAAGLPLWASLLMYPAAGTAVAVPVIGLLAWRSLTHSGGDRAQPAKHRPATA